jgi:hypothetical protein
VIGGAPKPNIRICKCAPFDTKEQVSVVIGECTQTKLKMTKHTPHVNTPTHLPPRQVRTSTEVPEYAPPLNYPSTHRH